MQESRQCIKCLRFAEDWLRDQLDWLHSAED
jgi:hypothetical protein